jgi:hypothetical protein
MLLYMVVDREALPEDALPWEIFIENTAEIDSTDLTLYVNALVDHTLCAPDELVVFGIAPNMCAWPGPDDPDYRSPQYQAQKEREADKMLDQIERHYPGFRQHIRTRTVGTPATIERYLLKNGGAVGGPKNALGQDVMNRLHARSEWKNLYICGDSTVMATGAPATAVSGVGAANMVLRDMRKKEYDARAFPRQYVHFVDLPYQRPRYRAGDRISASNAHLAAALCQGCEKPACVRGCPAGVDIPGFLRRIESRNTLGAARLLRERNPLAGVCGHVCAADELCQRRCYRKSFADAPVPIAALERWVCREAGEAGWLRVEPTSDDKPVADGSRIAVVGGGPSGLSCAYYCALLGCEVDLYERGDRPGGALWQIVAEGVLPQAALERGLQGTLPERVRFHGGRELGATLELADLQASYDAVYLALGSGEAERGALASTLGPDWDQHMASYGRTAVRPLYAGGDLLRGRQTVVEAVADGRRAAVAIGQDLRSRGKQ